MSTYKTITDNSLGHWNGYIEVSSDHPFYGKGYDTLIDYPDKENLPLNPTDPIGTLIAAMEPDGKVPLGYLAQVHGGITFAGRLNGHPEGQWAFGFDTAHAEDVGNPKDEAFVLAECAKLEAFLRSYEND